MAASYVELKLGLLPPTLAGFKLLVLRVAG
jgi:hypothetical protein